MKAPIRPNVQIKSLQGTGGTGGFKPCNLEKKKVYPGAFPVGSLWKHPS